MKEVFIITRTCYGEDYDDPETDIEVFETLDGAKKRFGEIIDEEEEYTDQDVGDEVSEESEDRWYLDFTDCENDYRVVMTLRKYAIK